MDRKLTRGSKLVLASHNQGKLRELAALMDPLGVEVVSSAALGLPEPVEDAPDFAGNKVRGLYLKAGARVTLTARLANGEGFTA